MKAITANPEKIREVFSKRYIIPDFQRPYSWNGEQCEKLWDDIIGFYDVMESKEDKYFLGNIVINPTSDSTSDAWEVVDGQQRLTTLILLIKALHSRAGTVKALEECLRIKHSLTSELTDELRVTSDVISEDRENLIGIVLRNADNCPKCKLLDNYKIFGDKIDEWWQLKGHSADELNNFILAVLDNIVLLPIHCGSEDDALTIFETINNRGMSLSDADIFKAKLYHNTDKEKQSNFINEWNVLQNHDWLFRILMHIVRAERGDSSKEIGMRSFFTASNSTLLANSDKIMHSLKVINAITHEWLGREEINCLWEIMCTYPNQYWNYPLYVYLHKYGIIDAETEEFSLPEEFAEQFTELMEATVKYFFIKGVVYNTVNAVRDTVFRVCVKIDAKDDYLAEYKNNLTKSDYVNLATRLEANQLGRYQRGLVLLSAFLHPKQDKAIFQDFLYGNVDIEHILPKKWNHYDGWSENTWSEQINTLGNLIPLAKAQNIAARNEFFDRKKIEYKKSTVNDALDLVYIPEWTPEEIEKKQVEKLSRLFEFLGIPDTKL